MKAAATVKYPWNQTETTPTFTGLPPHITILANFQTLMVEMESTKDAILSGLIAELDRRRISSQSHFDKEEILASMTTMIRLAGGRFTIYTSRVSPRSVGVGAGAGAGGIRTRVAQLVGARNSAMQSRSGCVFLARGRPKSSARVRPLF